MDLIDKKLGKEGDLDLVFEKGELKLKVSGDFAGADVGFYVTLDSDYFLDKLAASIPGQIDDAIIGMLKVALKK